MIDLSDKNIIDNYFKIKKELAAYDKNLLRKKEIIFLNKSDLMTEKDLKSIKKQFKERVKKNFEIISVFSKSDIIKLKKTIALNVLK